ncbi:patatin-like phospholipase family protein [Brachyspira pilosicoli]|uniref:Patatin n=1 Tax=Brachyspira pilosicoli TaxID=52584 RepID=A0A5C8EYC4_BRAPL|nr:patatin-like phospholipase family protein [Brachyspira pilosicoli]TXJ43017.1 patatin [Brachyspira pilosicoli]
MNKLGLVLGGGGGLGSYEIGVWKALREYNIDKQIKAISGASVGVLNACLMAQNDYTIAEHIWTKEIEDKILSKKKLDSRNKSISANGIFSREGLLEIIDKYLNVETVSNCKYPIYAAAVNLHNIDVEYFKLNGKSIQEIKEIMMATSAIPIIFGRQKINGVNYVDGGIEFLNGNNLPLTPLYEYGCDEIIVVNLYRDAIVEKSETCKVYEIVPNKDIGAFTNGGLDFTLDGAMYRIERGYIDTMEILKAVFEFKIMEDEVNYMSDKIKDYNIKSYNDRSRLKSKLYRAIDDLKIDD